MKHKISFWRDYKCFCQKYTIPHFLFYYEFRIPAPNFLFQEKLDKYLGMPSIIGKSKKEIFSVIRERVWKRINGWGEKMLSRAGKDVLIKAVLQVIPTYIMSCFALPKSLVNSILPCQSPWWIPSRQRSGLFGGGAGIAKDGKISLWFWLNNNNKL